MTVYEFEKGTPPGCPPGDAEPFEGEIFRAKTEKGPLPEERDFLSHRSLQKKCTAEDDCQCWGLSVWTDRESFDHLRKVARFARKWGVMSVSVSHEDGLLKPTPSNLQPEHYTFWKNQRFELSKKAKVIEQYGGKNGK